MIMSINFEMNNSVIQGFLSVVKVLPQFSRVDEVFYAVRVAFYAANPRSGSGNN